MTKNIGYQECKSCEPENNLAKCTPMNTKPQKIVLECGEGTRSATFTSSDDVQFKLAHVTVDTTCLNRPRVLIKFSSIVNMQRVTNTLDSSTVILQYELFRVCGDEEPMSLGIWMLERINVGLSDGFILNQESFNFIFCECVNYSRYCEYFVTVTPVEIINFIITVSNGRMVALSQSLCDSLKDERKTYDLKYHNSKFEQKHPKPEAIILSCGQGNGSVDFRGEVPQPPAEVAHVVIDTTCLNKPKVLIEFSSIIFLEFTTEEVQFQFELFRVCEYSKQPLSLGIWTFKIAQISLMNSFQKAFSFIFCESKAPSRCCEYFVRVKPIETFNVPLVAISIKNIRMTALAQSSRNSLYSDDSKTFNAESHCIACVPKRIKPKKILLECGVGTGSRTFTSSNDSAFQIAHVSIDTTCLCNPIVNIEFSSILSFDIMDSNVVLQLRYELFRVCDNNTPRALGIWSMDRVGDFFFDKSTETFDFTFCDCITCPGCCDYFVTVTPITITEGLITSTVSNGKIAVLAQEG